MKTLKRITAYLIWTLIALALGVLYMRMVLGIGHKPKEGFNYVFYMLYNWGMFYVGITIGAIIALLFILLDVFFLKKKLKNKSKSIAVRFGVLLIVTALVVVIHYLLEKIIDVI